MTLSEPPVTAGKPASRWYWRSLIALPFLFLAVFAFGARVDIADYFASHEWRVAVARPGEALAYARADWSLVSARLVGSEEMRLPLQADRRLVIVRLKAVPEGRLADAARQKEPWLGCSLTLVDDTGRRWSPISFVLSRDVSKALEPTATPVAGCLEASRVIGLDAQPTLVEEKFLIPAGVAAGLEARLSFRSSLPDAVSFPLELR